MRKNMATLMMKSNPLRKTMRHPLLWRQAWPSRLRVLLLSMLLAGLLVGLTWLPLFPLSQGSGVAFAHALPVRTDPASHAILQSPPARVTIWFDEAIVAATSHLRVQNAQGQQVDRRDSHLNPSDHRQMSVTLSAALPAGTYTVLWVAQSADDGHITQGSFTFRVVGSGSAFVPAGPHPGTGGGQGSVLLDGPTIVQAIMTWLALLFTTFWVGGLLWETWILTPGEATDPALEAATQAATRRFRRLISPALFVILAANVGLLVALAAEEEGSWSGAVQLPAWHAVLLSSPFGLFWGLRELVVLAALLLVDITIRRDWSVWHPPRESAVASPAAPIVDAMVLPDWRPEVVATLRAVPRFPAHLRAGWRQRSWVGRAELLLGTALLLAFALSGHAAAVPAAELGYALSVDVLHLVGNAAWVGGLLYIGFVLLPVLPTLTERHHARVLALGLPRFSAMALVCAGVLAATGSLNTSIHLTSLQQLVTTLYGRILAAKIEFFLLMVAISAYHAFFLRPRLARALRSQRDTKPSMSHPVLTTVPPAPGMAGGEVQPGGSPPAQPAHPEPSPQDRLPLSAEARALAVRMERWLRWEAWLGAAVLACVALLSIFAGTL